MSADRAARGRPRLFLVAAGVLLTGAIAVVAVGRTYWWGQEQLDPPSIELADAIPPTVKAIREASAGVRRSPHTADAWGRLGVVLLAFDYHPEATVCFANAERLAPRDPRWPYLQVCWRGPNDPEAIPKLRRAVDLTPDPPEGVRLQLAQALWAQGRLEEAESHFRVVLAGDPANPRAHLGLGRLTFSRGHFSESLAFLRRAAVSPLTRKTACQLLAQVHQASGDAAAAAREVERAEQLPADVRFPLPYVAQEIERITDDKTALSRAEQLASRGRPEEALAILDRLAVKYPDWGPAWLHRGQLLLQTNRHAAAESALRNAARLVPRSPKPYFYLGAALAEQGRHREAVAAFDRATELQPTYAEAHYGLGRSLRASGDRAGAIQSLRAAVRYLPGYVQARLALGELLADDGRAAEALNELRCADRLRPKDPGVTKLIQQLEAKHSDD
jgi:tetratricopeptide (TPR) repeat protein